MHGLESLLAAVTDPEAACLVVGRVRGRGDLAVAPLAREPRLDVVLLYRRGSKVAGGDVHYAVRNAELLHELLFHGKEVLMLVGAAFTGAEDEHLHLVELVHAKHPARVLAGSTGLAAEAGGEAGVAERERFGLEHLVRVKGGQADLRRAREVKVIALDAVDVHLVGGEEPG